MPVEEPIPTREGPGAVCNDAAVQHMVGQIGTGALGTEALRLSGARALRWIAPDAMVTMDYRTDRLNMHHDARNRITRINCG
jgi:hypothetical protein